MYHKFGFTCRPISINDGQKCVEIIYNRVKESIEYGNIEESEKSKEGKYCELCYTHLVYDFDDDLIGQSIDNVHNNIIELLNQRRVETNSKIKKRKDLTRKQKREQKKKKEKVQEEGVITKDIDIIVLLIQDLITDIKSEIAEQEALLYIRDMWYDWIETKIRRYKKVIEDGEKLIQVLERLKNKNGQLTLKDTRDLLLIINQVYKKLHIRGYNEWKLLPVEDIELPYTILPFYICVDLNDISELPRDCNNMQWIAKEELQDLENEEENER